MTVATYRLQLNADFRFEEVRSQVDYLRRLGVSMVYTSPILQARKGSTHGYDVIDPTRLNPELGDESDFDRMVEAARANDLDLLVDIVPNHMAASTTNPWWMDVLRQGPESPYASYFDVDWSAEDVRDNLSDKVLLPILGRPYGDVLEDQEIRIIFERGAFLVQYYDRRLPLNFASYVRILNAIRDRLAKRGEDRLGRDIEPLIVTLSDWGAPGTDSPEATEIRALQHRIASLASGNEPFRGTLENVLRILNGKRGDPESFDQLDTILDEQSYRLSFWRNAAEEINYRRFFDITDLISIRVSDPAVFDATHRLVLELISRGAIAGLRLDHIDGLFDPARYLEMLGSRLDDIAPGTLVVSEKILGEHEEMPETFRYRGTTGYEVAVALDRLFVSPEGFETLERAFAKTSGLEDGFTGVAHDAKIRVIRDLFRGELNKFARRFAQLTSDDRHARDLPLSALEEALVQFIASLPVYRTYVRNGEVSEQDLRVLDRTIADAKSRLDHDPAIGALEFLNRVLRLDTDDRSQRQEWLRFAMRFQQFTGPVTAKGVEDTALYIYTPLASLNEVGSEPVLPDDSIAAFHELNRLRLGTTPVTLSTTSTHDTKRGEDTRCRISVLSEIPDRWLRLFALWSSRYGARHTDAGAAPSDAEKWLFLQTLVGTWPLSGDQQRDLETRIAEYVPKALREAKVHSHWTDVDEQWEEATIEWVREVIRDAEFQKEMAELQKTVGVSGMINSLAMTTLKIASPGIPDIYQGSEMWNFSLVDPDNRRPVDFGALRKALATIEQSFGEGRKNEDLLSDLRENWTDGRIKLFTTWRALAARHSDPELFLSGDYVPLGVEGAHASHVVAFARHAGRRWAIAVAPVRSVTLAGSDSRLPTGEEAWGNTTVVLPAGTPSRWFGWMNGRVVESASSRLSLGSVLRELPVEILTSVDEGHE